MTDLQIVAVDPFDAGSFEPWWHAHHAAEVHDRGPEAPLWRRDEVRAELRDTGRRLWRGAWAGRVGGEVVATGWLAAPLLDNLTLAHLGVATHPDHRRRGHAGEMLRHLERQAAERGRTLLGGECYWPYAQGPEGDGTAGRELARVRGYALALGDIVRRLDLPVPGTTLDGLAAAASPHHVSYTLRSWIGPVPEELVREVAEMSALLMTEAPTGELDIEPEAADVQALREDEALLVDQGRLKYVTVALDQRGRVAAYSDLVTTAHDPVRAYQWGTLVRRADRGHRLGMAVKAANLRRLQAARPDLRAVITYNAEVNAPMVEVNDRLGFVPVERLGEFQKRLP